MPTPGTSPLTEAIRRPVPQGRHQELQAVHLWIRARPADHATLLMIVVLLTIVALFATGAFGAALQGFGAIPAWALWLVCVVASARVLDRPGHVVAGADGVSIESRASRVFIPWSSVQGATESRGRIELELHGGEVIVLSPESGAERGPFVARARAGAIGQGSVRSDLVDAAIIAAGEDGVRPADPADGALPYRERPISHEDLWIIARDTNANPAARMAALVRIAPEASMQERQELFAMTEATAHPQVRALMRAVSSAESVAVIDRLVREARRKPVRVR